MKLRTKIKVFSLIILCTMTLAIVLVGTFIIDETVYDLNRRLMSLEIASLLNRIHEGEAGTSPDRGVSNSGVRQKDAAGTCRRLHTVCFAATGDLFVVERPHTLIFHTSGTEKPFISSRDIDEMFRRKKGFIELHYAGKETLLRVSDVPTVELVDRSFYHQGRNV